MMRCQTQRFHVRPLFCCVVAPLQKAFLLLVGVAKGLQVNIKVRCGCAMRWVMAHGSYHEHITHWFVTSQTPAITFYMCNIGRWRRWTCQGSNVSSTHFRLGEFGLPLLPYDAIFVIWPERWSTCRRGLTMFVLHVLIILVLCWGICQVLQNHISEAWVGLEETCSARLDRLM